MAKSMHIDKSRYWNGICYQENMRPDWREAIDDLIQLPYAYCEHTLDKDSKSEHRKDHVHVIVVFNNTTTQKYALSVMNLLSTEGKTCCSAVQAAVSIRRSYDYLIHDTDSARKAGKYQYPPEARVTGNGFDIGAYEQRSTAEKQSMLQELIAFTIENRITNMADFMLLSSRSFGPEYFEIITAYNAFIERVCRGNYLKWKREHHKDEDL